MRATITKSSHIVRGLRDLGAANDERARAVLSAVLRVVTPVPPTTTERAGQAAIKGVRRDLASNTDLITVGRRTYSVADMARRMSKPPMWTRFLFRLVEELAPERIVELGAAAGVSCTTMALALRNDGTITTIDAATADLARKTVARAGVSDRVRVVEGRFEDCLEEVLDAVAPVDLMFIDGNHHEEPTLGYFDQALSRLSPDAVVIFDDIHWSTAMERTWDKITVHPRVAFSGDLHSLGVVGTRPPAR